MDKPTRPKPKGRPKQTGVVAADDRKISIRGVIDPCELRFCQIYLAFGKRDASEAYRRSFLRKNAMGEWIDAPRDCELSPDQLKQVAPALPDIVGRRAIALLKQSHIQDTLRELERSPSELARKTLTDQILFGSEREKIKAMERVWTDEDKLGFRDAVEKFWEISCEVGTEVVIPLGTITRTVHCAHCKKSSQVEIDLSVEAPVGDFIRANA